MSRRWVAGARVRGVAAVVLVAIIVVEVVYTIPRILGWTVFGDFVVLRDATSSWLAGGPFYPAYQLAGPFVIGYSDILYPPPALVLFVPFTVLPAVLWWVIPLLILDLSVAACRPRGLALLAIAACLLYPKSIALVMAGNPSVWLAAAMAVGMRWGWPTVVLAFKPTLAPLAFIGIRHRSWWPAAGIAILVSLAFLPMWPDYLTVLRHAQNPLGPLYSIGDLPLVLVGVVARIGRRRPDAVADGAAVPTSSA